jgi:hypothetical protein
MVTVVVQVRIGRPSRVMAMVTEALTGSRAVR